jgi:hypothetical protein
MSGVYTWDISVIAPTSGSVDFQEVAPSISDTIHAGFMWHNAVYYPTGGCYATMYIYDPDNEIVASYIEESVYGGEHILSWVTDKVGNWRAEIKIWDGDEWLTLTDFVLVSGPYMVIDPASTFYEGPFIAQTMQILCDVHARNDGNEGAQVHIGLYAYPGTASEAQIGYLYTGASVAPGGIVQQVFELIVPGEHAHTWPLGVKVWGAGEVEPSFGVAGVVGKAALLGSNIGKRPPLESEAEAMLSDGR